LCCVCGGQYERRKQEQLRLQKDFPRLLQLHSEAQVRHTTHHLVRCCCICLRRWRRGKIPCTKIIHDKPDFGPTMSSAVHSQARAKAMSEAKGRMERQEAQMGEVQAELDRKMAERCVHVYVCTRGCE
jgi:hypothetical protein